MFDAAKLRQRLDFIRQGSETERYHTKRKLQVNDVGHHSFHVAWLAHIMADGAGHDCNPGLILAALSHDLAEHVTGDMPGDFKREAGLRDLFGEQEAKLLNSVGLNYEAFLSDAEKRILKLADVMEGAFYCISEASLGNKRIGEVYLNFWRYIHSMTPFNETEGAIVLYIGRLWEQYAFHGGHGAPGWNQTSHAQITAEETMTEESDDGLVAALRREEAEGRATPGPQSNAPIQGDASVPEQVSDDATDDRAGQEPAPERPSSPANARQVGGAHYKDVGYEHWDLVLDTGMNYFQGCATKYVTRWRKHDAGEQNLLKAIHYVDKVEEAEVAGRIFKQNFAYPVEAVSEFAAANRLNELETQVVRDIIAWRWENARTGLEQLRAGYSVPQATGPARSYYSDQ